MSDSFDTEDVIYEFRHHEKPSIYNVDREETSVTGHYTQGEIECVDYLWDNMNREAFIGGLEWNTKKYLHRWRNKGEPLKDLRKAYDYLGVLIMVMEGKEPKFKEFDKGHD